MRLKTILVESYGSLSRMSIPCEGQLSEGLNVLFGPNEAGKSQLKVFLEGLLFPKSNQRGTRETKTFGRATFSHDGGEYSLEVSRKGSASLRQLYRGNNLVDMDISHLFPSLTVGGSEVFSNLYSFGLDELLSNTISGSGVLSEHLFGAIASGKGISISSVFDRLDDQIKRLTGREAKIRSLTKVLEDLESANELWRSKIGDEKDFIERYRRKEDVLEQIHQLKIESEKASTNLAVCREVQRMAEDYESYSAATEFLAKYSNFDELTPTLLRFIESRYSRLVGIQTSIEEFGKKISDTCVRLRSFDSDHRLLSHAQTVRAAENIIEDVKLLRRDLAERTSKFEARRAEVQKRAAQSGTNAVDWFTMGEGSDLQSNIETLENARGSLDLLQRQRVDHLASPLVDAGPEVLIRSQGLIEESISKVKDLIEVSASRQNGHNNRLWTRMGVASLVAVAAIAGLNYANVVRNPFGVILEVAAGLGVVAAVALLRSPGSDRTNRQRSANHKVGIAKGGFEKLDRRQLTAKLEQYQDEKKTVEAILKIRGESERISDLIRGLGMATDETLTLETAMAYISSLIDLMRDALEVKKINREVIESQIRLQVRTQDLVACLASDFQELELRNDLSVDRIQVIVSNLAERLASSMEMDSQAKRLERDLVILNSEISRLTDELQVVNRQIDEALAPFGYTHDSLDERLLELMNEIEQNHATRTVFVRSAQSVFGDELQQVLPYFGMGSLELGDFITTLGETVRELNEQRDSLLRFQAEIESEERSLLEIDSVAECQSTIESLNLEAEELADRLRVNLLARQLLKNAHVRFEDLHQPELLRSSSDIFARVTQGRYVSVLKKDTGKGESIYVRNRSGEDILDAHLSRGTREQLFISIRLALVTRTNSLDIPLLMDDVMVNADIERAQGLANELATVAQTRQILYFCAKPDALRLFEDAGANVNLVEMTRLH